MNNLCHYNEQCGKMSNNNTANADNDANTVIPSTPMYVSNTSNGNGGNMNVLYLTVNTWVIEDNHIGQNTRKNYVRTLTNIMVWMVDNMSEKLVDREALEKINTRDMGILSDTKRKQGEFLKTHRKFLLGKINRAAKNSYKIGG